MHIQYPGSLVTKILVIFPKVSHILVCAWSYLVTIVFIWALPLHCPSTFDQSLLVHWATTDLLPEVTIRR